MGMFYFKKYYHAPQVGARKCPHFQQLMEFIDLLISE
jgi:hypothetical protein